jgi:gamma-glutamylcyclotransferase
MFNYFAYGSNLLRARLVARVSIIEDCGVRTLPGRQLHFHKRGRDGSGKCNIADCNDSLVYGVLYKLTNDAMIALDKIEGSGGGYQRITIPLGSGIQAQTYIAEASWIDAALAPFTWYRDLVIAGAKEHHFPEPYIAQLFNVRTLEDPDFARNALNRSLISR